MLKLYNSLSRKIEEFKPIHPLQVGLYVCGPTVYQFAHIGNFRAYLTSDILVRVLNKIGYDVSFVMNITDVGHMTLDQAGGGDSGEDKLEKTARNEGKSVWEVAEFYTDVFLKDYKALQLTEPDRFSKATDHIREQIDLIKKIEEKGFTYRISDGIYFDTARLKDYGRLSDMDPTNIKARVDSNDEKKNPRDFALWKYSKIGENRQMEWDSPWGKGFPGWHIECSAMSMKYLGTPFDIHTGGIDHKEIHHPNEIAQTEVATEKLLANYWVHTAFVQVSGEKMSKSLGNAYTVYDLEKEGYSPIALRYLYLQTHYRKDLNFTFSSLDQASNAYKNIIEELITFGDPEGRVHKSEDLFMEAMLDDLNTPQALAVMWELLKSDNPPGAKVASIYKMDEILGLGLREQVMEIRRDKRIVPEHIRTMVREREKLRKERHFMLADQMRARIEKLGYEIEDSEKGTKVCKKN